MPTEMKLPVGIQTFSKIREGGYLYVDKTAFIYELANNYEYVFLSRPRRFGKSLLLSTFEEYFKGNRELFKGLAIENLESDWKSYAVLRFDLSAANYNHPEVLEDKISAYLSRMEQEYDVVPEKRLGDRFMNVILAAYRKTGNRVVILVDEYDKPMLDSVHDDCLQRELKAELRGFYAVLKECDAMIRFAMLSGVTKFGKVSIFSGLNNLEDISMMDDFNEICGISERELHINFPGQVKSFAQHNEISETETWNQFKRFYDGYHFSKEAADIYNPFSTLSAFKKRALGSYWFASGSSDYLTRLIRRHKFILKDLEGEQRTESQLCDITNLKRDLVPLLYQAGYLTIKSYDRRFGLYTLGFPNREVSQGFWNSLADYFFYDDRNGSIFNLHSFVLDLEQGKAESFMKRVGSLFASISNEHEADKEVHFQNMLTIFTKMLGFEVNTEVHSSQGRSDMEIKTSQFIYIIELKIDGTAKDALSQIHEKGYFPQYESDPRTKILIGVNFSTKTRTIATYVIEKLPFVE